MVVGSAGEKVFEGKPAEAIEIGEQDILEKTAGLTIQTDDLAGYAHYLKGYYGIMEHGMLCNSYLAVRSYDHFEKCVQSWFKREEHAEPQTTCSTFDLSKQQMHYWGGQLLGSYAFILMEQGHGEQALKEIERALMMQAGSTRCTMDAFTMESNTKTPVNIGARDWIPLRRMEGIIHAQSGNRDAALKSVKTIERLYGPNLDRLQMSKDNAYFKKAINVVEMELREAKAEIYLALEMYAEALKETEFDFDLSGFDNSWGGENSYPNCLWKYIRAKSLFELGRYEEARDAYTELMDLESFSQWGDIFYRTMYEIGMIDAKAGREQEAIENIKKSVKVIESQRSSVATESGRIGFVGDKQEVYKDLVDLLIKTGNLEAAFEFVERSKSRTLVDMLAAKTDFAGGADVDIESLLIKLDKAEQKERTKGLLIPSQRSENQDELLRSDVETNVAKIKQKSGEVTALVAVDALSADEIYDLLQPGETLIEYYGGKESILAFIVSKQSIQVVNLVAKDLSGEITKFRKEILDYNSAAYKESIVSLYKKILAPVVPYIKTSKITIVAHGPLHYLPFNALHDGDSYLIDKYSIRMLPSASVLEFLGEGNKMEDSMLVLANPDLGNTQYDLPAAEKEGWAIAQGKINANVLSRKSATETALRKYGATTSRLHIASHGQFKAEEPLKSRLLLAGDGENDGNLTVDELYSLELNSDLVTLSACETGLGDVKNGDDVIGLTRGFLFAGADSIVSSLWVVDDTATENLMVAFYDGLEKNSKQEALRQAQLKIKNEYNEHPFFWAAFQLTGSM